MKKFLTSLVAIMICIITAFSLVGCTEWSGFSNDTSNVVSNSGIAVKHDGYLYFINGTKTTSATANKGDIVQGAIYKVKLDSEGEIAYKEDGETFEEISKVVNALVGFDEGSIHIFGNYLYYVTTSNRKNSAAEVLYQQFEFNRYDLKSGKSETFYRTAKNDDTISYAFYQNDNTIDFVIFEQKSATLTSLSIGDSVSENFKKTEVTGAVLSENYGISTKTTAQNTVDDADCYVYYTKAAVTDGEYRDGNRVYFASSDGSFDKLLNEKNEKVTLLTVRAGKLLYTVNDYIYADSIDASKTALGYDTNNLQTVISYKSYDNVLFMERDNGLILLVYEGSEISFIDWSKNYPEFTKETLYDFGSDSIKVKFIGIDGDYLVMTVDKVVNKIKISNNTGEEIVPIPLTTSKFEDATALMAPEIADGYVYGFVSENSQKYMYRVSLETPEGAELEEAEFVGVKEDKK